MSIIKLEQFGGLLPRTHPRLIPADMATVANNCKLWSGKLGAWYLNDTICDPAIGGEVQTIYLYEDSYWFIWNEVVDVSRGAISADETNRVYWTGGPEGQPQVSDNTLAYSGNEEAWVSGEYYNVGDLVIPTGATPSYGVVWEAQTAGKTAGTEPTWGNVGETETDGEVQWLGLTRPGHTPPDQQQADPPICWALPWRSYHLGVPAPTTAPTVGRTGLGGPIYGIREYGESFAGNTAKIMVNHDGLNAKTITLSFLAKVIVETNHQCATSSFTVRMMRGYADQNPVELATETIEVEGTATEGEPDSLDECGSGTWPDATLEITETMPPGEYQYYVALIKTNINPNTSGVSPPGDCDKPACYYYNWNVVGGFSQGLLLNIGENHPFSWNDRVVISGVGGIEEINGTHTVIAVNETEIGIEADITVTDPDDWDGNGTWEQLPSVSDEYDRAYVYTFVAIMGGKEQEGPPSPVSDIIGVKQDDTNVQLSGFEVPPAGYNISRIRIYRTVEGEANTTFKFIAEIIWNDTWVDTNTETEGQFGEVIPSTDWNPPPTDLANLTEMPNGILVGTSGRDIWFCEPFQPHAWPSAYSVSVTDDPVALGAFGNSVAVLTDGWPWLLTGTHPDSMSMDKLEISQACVSKRSVADMGYAVIYACPDGLFMLGVNVARMVTKDIFTKDEWAKLAPESIIAARYDNRYVFFYDNGTEQGGFVFDPDEPRATLTRLDFYATAMHTHPKTGDLFMMVDDFLVQFDADTDDVFTAIWKSKEFVMNEPVNFGVAQIQADGYPVMMYLYTNDEAFGVVERVAKIVENSDPFRLPAGYLHAHYQIEIASRFTVTGVYIAETPEELKRV